MEKTILPMHDAHKNSLDLTYSTINAKFNKKEKKTLGSWVIVTQNFQMN